jgi:aminoglycoside phosphotransferase (APT) family kinase protein
MLINPILDTENWFRQRQRLFYPKTDMPVPDELLRGLRARTFDALRMTPERVALAAEQALGVVPTGVHPLEQQGTFHRVFRLTAPGRTTTDRLILRANAAGDFLLDLAAYLDAWAGSALAEAGLPAVAVRHVDLSRTVVPFDFQISDECAGQTLDRFNEDEPRMRRLLRQLGRFAAETHGLALDGFGLLDARPLAAGTGPPRGIWTTWDQFVRRNLETHVADCARAGDVSTAEAETILAAFERHADCLRIAGGVLLHGDLGSHNVMTDGDRLLGLIDWEDALAGDPVFDVASWATFHLPARHAGFLDGYREIRALPDDFAIRFWLYFLRIAVAKAVHRRRFGYRQRPDRPTAAHRIRYALDQLTRAA